MKNLRRRSLTVAAVLACAAPAFASPPSMAAVTFPVSLASITTAVATAGGLLLLGYFGLKIGFSVAKKLLSRVKSAI